MCGARICKFLVRCVHGDIYVQSAQITFIVSFVCVHFVVLMCWHPRARFAFSSALFASTCVWTRRSGSEMTWESAKVLIRISIHTTFWCTRQNLNVCFLLFSLLTMCACVTLCMQTMHVQRVETLASAASQELISTITSTISSCTRYETRVYLDPKPETRNPKPETLSLFFYSWILSVGL